MGIREFAQLFPDSGQIIGDDERTHDLPAKSAAERDDRRPRQVFTLATRYGIADGKDGDAHRELLRFYGVAVGFVHQAHGFHQ